MLASLCCSEMPSCAARLAGLGRGPYMLNHCGSSSSARRRLSDRTKHEMRACPLALSISSIRMVSERVGV